MPHLVPTPPNNPLKGAQFSNRTAAEFRLGTPRQLDIGDLVSIVSALSTFKTSDEKLAKDSNKSPGRSLFGYTEFYEWCLGETKVSRREAAAAAHRIPSKDHENLQLGVFNSWRDRFLANPNPAIRERPDVASLVPILTAEKRPETIAELRALLTRQPLLNQMGPVLYQGDGNFVHFRMDRHALYQNGGPGEGVRIYLNPTIESVPTVAYHLCKWAQTNNAPLYLKLADASLRPELLLADTMGRRDQIIVLTSHSNAQQILNVIDKLTGSNPGWFAGRESPTLCAKVSQGVGIAEDPHTALGDGRSFNDVRAKLLEEVTHEVTRKVVTLYPGYEVKAGETIKDLLLNKLEEKREQFSALRKQGYSEKSFPDFQPAQVLDAALKTGFDPEKMLAHEISSKVLKKVGLDKIIQAVTPTILPSISPEWLLPRFQQELRSIAPRYRVNPEDLARNL